MFENLPSLNISARFIKTIEVIFDAGLAVQMSPKAICRRICDAEVATMFNFSCKDRRNFVDVFYAQSSVADPKVFSACFSMAKCDMKQIAFAKALTTNDGKRAAQLMVRQMCSFSVQFPWSTKPKQVSLSRVLEWVLVSKRIGWGCEFAKHGTDMMQIQRFPHWHAGPMPFYALFLYIGKRHSHQS
jgi:hypothetical protein